MTVYEYAQRGCSFRWRRRGSGRCGRALATHTISITALHDQGLWPRRCARFLCCSLLMLDTCVTLCALLAAPRAPARCKRPSLTAAPPLLQVPLTGLHGDDTDADSISGSNSTYEFAGMHSDQPELLYTRPYSRACAMCREPSSVTVDNCSCPVVSTVGRWQQQTIHPAVNVVAQRKVILQGIKEFQVVH